MPTTLTASKAKIDSTLIGSYNVNDLRKTLYFQNNNGVYSFRGSMSGAPIFSGLATDEIYLIQAECKARKGDISGAMTDLNAILIKRWRNNTFVPYSAATPAEALNKVLEERRKELVFRCIRFSDIKRLNKDGANIIIRRKLNGVEYVLQPNSKRYALEIPQDVIEITGMAQNER
jgi:hypothetical protein